MSQAFVVYTHAFCPTQNITTDLMAWDKMEDKNKKWCKLVVTSTTDCLNVALFQYSMNSRARIPQSYLQHN